MVHGGVPYIQYYRNPLYFVPYKSMIMEVWRDTVLGSGMCRIWEAVTYHEAAERTFGVHAMRWIAENAHMEV